MAANANHNPSARATAAAAPSFEELPVVEVFTTGFGVVVKWGEGGAQRITVLHPDTTLYSDAPYSFSALDSNGDEPLIKTFGTLLGCDGGVLTIGDMSYRIDAQPVVEVFTTGVGVVVKWGEGGAKQTTAGLLDNYTDSFHALDSNGDEPFRKTFGTLLNCSGGILTIGQTRYRIVVHYEQQWTLYPGVQVAAWQGFDAAAKLTKLPDEPFLVTSDARTRYELINKFIMRECFAIFEKSLLKASKSAADNRRVAAMSVLGAKGAGKSVFFRFFCYKHCSDHVVVFVPDAGTDATEIYKKLITSLIFGLQCFKACNDQEKLTKERFLLEVKMQPRTGTFALFWSLWHNWKTKYRAVCTASYFVIDQLQREGDLFHQLSSDPIDCAGYILISSTGILHHHNLSSVYEKLVYNFPVSPAELAEFDDEKKLDNVGYITTMMGAISILEEEPVASLSLYKDAAQKHFKKVKEDDLLKMLLAVVQSEESGEAIDGGIWEEVLDPNYLWIGEDKMVQVADKEYVNELRELLRGDKVEYKNILMDLLSSQDIVNEVGNAALGIHVEALLDIMWQELTEISWSQQRELGTPRNRSSRSRQNKKVAAVAGESFESIQPICFDGDVPAAEDLAGLDWNKVIYFKPRRTIYAGFDMFILKKVQNRCGMHAIQVTVQNAAQHDVKAFDDTSLQRWNTLLQGKIGSDPDWQLYMLTPEDDPPATLPESVLDAPIYQVGFSDLIPSGERYCGLEVVREFPAFLKNKKARKRQKTS